MGQIKSKFSCLKKPVVAQKNELPAADIKMTKNKDELKINRFFPTTVFSLLLDILNVESPTHFIDDIIPLINRDVNAPCIVLNMNGKLYLLGKIGSYKMARTVLDCIEFETPMIMFENSKESYTLDKLHELFLEIKNNWNEYKENPLKAPLVCHMKEDNRNYISYIRPIHKSWLAPLFEKRDDENLVSTTASAPDIGEINETR